VTRLGLNTLAGRLIALLLSAVLLSQIISVFLFADIERSQGNLGRQDQFFRQATFLIDAIIDSTRGMQPADLRRFSSPEQRYWITERSSVSETHHNNFLIPPAELFISLVTQRGLSEPLVEFRDDPNTIFDRLFDLNPAQGRDNNRPQRRPGQDGPQGPAPQPDSAAAIGAPDMPLGQARDGDGGPRFIGPTPRDPPQWRLAVQLPDGRWFNAEMIWPRSNQWAKPLWGQVGLMALATVLIVIVVVQHTTKGLRHLAAAADKLGRGEVIDPLTEVGPDEVKRTTSAFNLMNERLQRFIESRTRMLAAISHDLRTPITALRIRAELVPDEENRTRMLATLQEMQELAEATLAMIREDATREDSNTVELNALAESVCDDLADMGTDVVYTGRARLTYRCRANGLKRVLRNLVENAAKYGQRSRVRLESNASNIIFTIDDDGPGIPAKDIERVFQPFVRLEESRNKATGGFGLGLSIARSIVRSHGGDLTLENRREGGLRATVQLPLSEINA
jgi:signal transduction histidine kinase